MIRKEMAMDKIFAVGINGARIIVTIPSLTPKPDGASRLINPPKYPAAVSYTHLTLPTTPYV